MSGKKVWPAAAMAAGFVALAALIGCGGDRSVASKSAAAFEEAQKKGETFGGEGHAHGGHGAATPADEHAEAVPQEPSSGEEHHAGHGAADAPDVGGMQHGTEHQGSEHSAEHAGHGAAGAGSPGGGHAAMGHGQTAAAAPEAVGHAGHGAPSPQEAPAGHAGHGAPSPQAPAGHAGHSASGGAVPPAQVPQAPVAALPGQPAAILRPDALDAPAPTSVIDAQRSAEMNQAMSGGGGHGGHGSGTYRHIDAGRSPGAYEGSEPQTPGAGPQEHDHGAAEPPTAPAREQGHSHEPSAASAEQAVVYACPMHPEVTSNTPGTCPKCGMALVERRKE